MGLVVDFVPNHMGIDPQTNAWWRDVLENGAELAVRALLRHRLAPVKEELRDKVLLPILGDQYGQVLERGELQVAHRRRRAGAAVLRTQAADQSAARAARAAA